MAISTYDLNRQFDYYAQRMIEEKLRQQEKEMERKIAPPGALGSITANDYNDAFGMAVLSDNAAQKPAEKTYTPKKSANKKLLLCGV